MVTPGKDTAWGWKQAYSQALVLLRGQPVGMAANHPDVRPGGLQLETEEKKASPSNSTAKASDTLGGRDVHRRKQRR